MANTTVKVGKKKKAAAPKAAATPAEGTTNEEATPADGAETPEPAKDETKRTDFPTNIAVDAEGTAIALDEDGRMTALPANWDRRYKGLRRNDFTTKVLYCEWKVYLLDAQLAKVQKRRNEALQDVEDAKKGGDPTRKKIRSATKMAAQLKDVLANLAKDGITLEDLGLEIPAVPKTEAEAEAETGDTDS